MVGYYDRVLLGMAGSLFGGVILSIITPTPVLTGVLVGSAIATLFMYDAMVRNPPVPPRDPRVTFPSVVWHVAVFALLLLVYVE